MLRSKNYRRRHGNALNPDSKTFIHKLAHRLALGQAESAVLNRIKASVIGRRKARRPTIKPR